MSKCLAVVGAASIQDYIFRSNRLREQVAASQMIEDALELWEDRAKYVGGGHAAIEFASRQEAMQEIYRWSLGQLQQAPGLRFSVGYADVTAEWPHVLQKAIADRQRCQEGTVNGGEPGAMPIIRTCPSTGLAATAAHQDDEGRPLSAEAASKRGENLDTRRRYRTELNGWAFPFDLDELGTTENASQVAVVHCDGNGIGELIKAASDSPTKLQDLSRRLTQTGRAVWSRLVAEMRSRAERWHAQGELKLAPHYMPIRPIIDGGDDATWVCAGRLGLASAVRYLQLFEEESRRHLDITQNLTACAGVAIVPGGYPFSRAYRMATTLCGNAKDKSRTQSGLDFQVVLGGSTQELDDIRTPTSVYKRFSARPLLLGSEWEGLHEALLHFQRRWPRSRAKSLLRAFGRGTHASEIQIHASRSYRIPETLSDAQKFDALEALDFYLPWNEPQVGEE